MTTTDPNDAPAQPQYPAPPGLTSAGQRAYQDAVRDFADRLADQIKIEARRAHPTDGEYTARDVREARQAHERSLRDQAEVRDSDHRVLAALLVTAGSVGFSVMANFLHSALQIVVFVLLALTGIVGLVLTWSSRPKRR